LYERLYNTILSSEREVSPQVRRWSLAAARRAALVRVRCAERADAGVPRVRSYCRFAPPFIHFIPYFSNIFGSSFWETTVRPNPRCASARRPSPRAGARRGCRPRASSRAANSGGHGGPTGPLGTHRGPLGPSPDRKKSIENGTPALVPGPLAGLEGLQLLTPRPRGGQARTAPHARPLALGGVPPAGRLAEPARAPGRNRYGVQGAY
jgi:hypothetical protein